MQITVGLITFIVLIAAGGILYKENFYIDGDVVENTKGQQVKAEIPPLPIVNDIKTFTNKWDFYDLFYQSDFSNVKYKLINNKNHTYVSGGLDEHGRTQRMTTSNNENHDLLIGTDDDWTVSMDDESDDDDFQYDCGCESQEDHEHEGEI